MNIQQIADPHITPFSNDAFGQHYASEHMFNDLVDQNDLFYECMKYYANILTPFSARVDKKIKEIVAMNIPIRLEGSQAHNT